VNSKIAFIKFGGMAFGGTEKVLQTIAANLPKNRYDVDFFYCDAAPYVGSNFQHIDTDNSRIEYCLENKVNLIKFNVGYKDVTTPYHDWLDTDFWDYFDENNYDLLITGRGGYKEYPFYLIENLTTIDTIHLSDHAENKSNVFKSVLLSNEQRKKWVQAGGKKRKSIIIPNPVEILSTNKSHDIGNKFVFGMHQRDDDNIFSSIPLEAYSQIESSNTMFLLLGGSSKYKEQSDRLGIKNIQFFPTTPKLENIHKFLNSLNVYAHGRKDGEQCSTAIIEAMSHGLPVISHTAPSMGQAEQISEGGFVAKSVLEYSGAMKKFINEKDYYELVSISSKNRYENTYSVSIIIEKYVNLIQDALETKPPNKINKKLLELENYLILLKLYSVKILRRILRVLKKVVRIISRFSPIKIK